MGGPIETDYLVVGSGAAGMAFTDSLIAHSDVRVVLVDRRHAPGGHWNDAYSFCRLHQPSAFYGVDSLPLGRDTIDTVGLNRGGYERATAPEVAGYFHKVLDEVLLPTGRVRHLPMSEYVGDGRVVSRVTGDETKVRAARVVDATFMEGAIPATSPPPFEIDPEAVCVPVGALPHLDQPGAGYVIIGAGKTAMDAVIWLLEQGTDPDLITWIKPREAWLTNRAFFQPLTLSSSTMQGLSHWMEAGAQATTLDEFMIGLEERGVLLRVDPDVWPEMAKIPTINELELAELQRVTKVVRQGHVRRIGRDEIELDHGTVPTSPDQVHVHCAAPGIPSRPGRDVFEAERITVQPLRWGMLCLSAAVTGFVEATRGDDLADKNRLCPPQTYPDRPAEVAEMLLSSLRTDQQWMSEPDVEDFSYRSRLNPAGGWKEQLDQPEVAAALQGFLENVGGAVSNLQGLSEQALATP